MEQTSNLKLKKPSDTDLVNIHDINNNMDILDVHIAKAEADISKAQQDIAQLGENTSNNTAELRTELNKKVNTSSFIEEMAQKADASYVDSQLELKANQAEIPAALPNPKSITFTGAVSASYDGREEVTVAIPAGGGSGISPEDLYGYIYIS